MVRSSKISFFLIVVIIPLSKEAIMRNLNVGKLQLLRKKLIGIIVTIGLIFSTLTVLVPTIEAQDGRHDRDRDRPRYEERDHRFVRAEFERGYRDGRDEGRDDAREHRRFSPEDSRRFRNGSRPYREGFMRGYRESYHEFNRHRDHDRHPR